jgi:hypothetical protein
LSGSGKSSKVFWSIILTLLFYYTCYVNIPATSLFIDSTPKLPGIQQEKPPGKIKTGLFHGPIDTIANLAILWLIL